MWKIIILLSLSMLVQAADIEKFFQTWTQVAYYPISGYIPSCVQFAFDKDAKEIDCACVDGKIAKMVELNLVLETGKAPIDAYPMVAVDSAKDVKLDVECTCRDKHYTSRVVVRSVNPNYFVMYELKSHKNYTAAEPNDAYVFAKETPKYADLVATLHSIEDLKNRKGTHMCSSDVNLSEP